ncbi:hypothetical protein AOQ84DRAFT_388198, partial [Glonium stellatum]
MLPIAETSLLCMHSFHLLFSSLANSKPEFRNLMPPDIIDHEYRRLRVWCGNLGTQQKGHASLDFRLRESNVMHENVVKLLEQLRNNLSESVSVISGARLPYEQQSSLSNLSQDDSSDSDEQTTELEMRLSSIRDILNHMNKLSFTIRNPALRPKSLKAISYRETIQVGGEQQRIEQPVNMDEEVRHRILRWLEPFEDFEIPVENPENENMNTRIDLSMLYGKTAEDPYATQEREVDIFDVYGICDRLHMVELFRGLKIATSPDQPPVNKTIFERLVQGITKRRRQIRYWSRHAEKLAAGSFLHDVRLEVPQLSRIKPSDENHTEAEEISTKEPAPIIAPSTIFPTTEVSASYNQKLASVPDSSSVVSYASTAWDIQGRGVELPPPPREAALGNDFVCPYCSILCPAKHGQGRSWRGHVFQDLQAYMCTYDNCAEASRMYGSRSQWVEHEAQLHRKVWRCYEHTDAVFESPELLERHLGTQHAEKLTESQIADLIAVAETSLIDERQICPICLVEGHFERGLQNHLANHLERIALFALPRPSNETIKDSNTCSNASQGVGARSQATWSSSSLPSSDQESSSDKAVQKQQPPSLQILEGHTDSVSSVAFS